MTIYFEKLDSDLASASVPYGTVTMAERPGFYRNFFKRALDISAIIIVSPIAAPLILILALLVSLDGGKPFYWSKRVGRSGVEFPMLKLRTMVLNADKMLAEHLNGDPAAKAEWAANQKLKNDPRITSVGKFLRKASLDELPQLWNVLIGDMSLVGPRPMMSEQRALYPGLSYYALRPGITGPWQVSDRNECEFAKRADHDRQYDNDLSLGTDIRILTRTIGVVIRGTGY